MSTWVTGLDYPLGIAIDSSNEYLYVANFLNSTISKISISNPTGDNTPAWAILATGFQPRALAIDSTNTYLYVSTDTNSSISRILISDPSTIVNDWATGFDSPLAIAINNVYMYVLNTNSNTISKITIGDTPTVTTWVDSSQGLSYPTGIAIDSNSTYMYVSNNVNNSISKITIEDTPTVTNNWATNILTQPTGCVIDNTNTYIYVTNFNDTISRITIGAPSTVTNNWASGFSTPVYPAIDSSSTYLYVSNSQNNTITRLSLPLVCFKENSKILTNKGYIPIQDLKKGDLVKTLKHGYRAIDMISKRKIVHQASKDRIKDQLYKCSKDKFAEVFQDLIITGCHSILVDDFISQEQEDKTRDLLGVIYFTDGLIRLPACVDERTLVYETPGTYTIYHLALENEDNTLNYAIYANGLLVETCSNYYLKELSNMELIE